MAEVIILVVLKVDAAVCQLFQEGCDVRQIGVQAQSVRNQEVRAKALFTKEDNRCFQHNHNLQTF
ncbi:UNKNOWN [Stylonychia lemnae]|uniref:Secreted protein n=1 Tax=Stylonychia lemnae TaxID=5949 RepID=A0A077ZRX5_STYLE|nr:UNKNOWN [Stylonychia lemnae]|eukprot:CDW72229.1 UNKNOWN [Stylonychia lemnae]